MSCGIAVWPRCGRRRVFALPALLVVAALPAWRQAQAAQALLSSCGSERATSGNGSKIITYEGKTHVAWQNSTAEGYFARVRTFDHKTGRWSKTTTLGKGADNHCRPTLTIDSKGHLHAIIGGHHTGLQYRRSLRPNDASEWTEVVSFGKTTYPVLICGPDDTLYLTGRHDANWKGLDLYVKPPGQPWQRRGLLVQKGKKYKWYGAYHNALVWGPDHKTLHLSTGFFEGKQPPKEARGDERRRWSGHHQAVGYMQSRDFGKTWQRADGTPVPLPATAKTIDMIAEAESANPQPGIQHCGMAVDSKNRPYLVYVRHTPKPGQSFLVTPDEQGKWQRRPLQAVIEKNWPGLGALGYQVSMTDDNVLCLVGTLVPIDHPKANWSPGQYGLPPFWTRSFPEIQRIVWLESGDGGKTFSVRPVVPHEADKGTLVPSIERPTGFNHIAAGRRPTFLYFVGLSRYTKKNEVIDNKVYWVTVP